MSSGGSYGHTCFVARELAEVTERFVCMLPHRFGLLDEMKVPVFAFDREQQVEAMGHLLAMRNEGCRLLFGHDLEQFRSVPTTGLT